MAASVRKVDESPITFPANRKALDFILDMLDTEGLEAAQSAFEKIVAPEKKDGDDEDGEGDGAADVAGAAKN